jgi:hypothetical protein
LWSSFVAPSCGEARRRLVHHHVASPTLQSNARVGLRGAPTVYLRCSRAESTKARQFELGATSNPFCK